MRNIVKRTVIIVLALLIAASLALYLHGVAIRKADAEYHAGLTKTLKVTSSDFAAEGDIPTRFTCLGSGEPPELEWNPYVPPCPPLGQHAYVFRVYALDVARLTDTG